MAHLKLFYSTGSSDSITLKNYFDDITTTDNVVVNESEILRSKCTFVSYSLDEDIDSPYSDPNHIQASGEGISTPTLIFISDGTTYDLDSDDGISVVTSSFSTPKIYNRIEITDLEGLANADTLYELIISNND